MRTICGVVLLWAMALVPLTRTAMGAELQAKSIRGAEALADSLGALNSFLAKSAVPSAAAQQDDSRDNVVRMIEGAQMRVSGKVIQQLVARPVEQSLPVNEEMLGIPLTGQARLTGATRLELVENPERGVFDILLTGTIVSTTTGDAGKAHIHTQTTTRFAARKRILLDARGLTALPARCNAKSAARLMDTSSPLPGLRGRLAQRISWRRAQDSLAQAEQIAARRAADRVCRQLDQEAAVQVAAANQVFHQQLRELAAHRELKAPLKFCTTSQHLLVSGMRSEPAKLRIPDAMRKLEQKVAAVVVLPAAALDLSTATNLLSGMAGGDAATSMARMAREVLPKDVAKMLEAQHLLNGSDYTVRFAVDSGRLVMALLASDD